MNLNKSEKEIVVVGVGNILLGDEGVGIRAVELLERSELPANVKVLDLGTNFLDITSHIDNAEKLIIIDAISAGNESGRLYRFRYDELEAIKANMRSAHQISILNVLKLLRELYANMRECEVVLIGVEPKTIDMGLELSQEVESALPRIIEKIDAEIAQVLLIEKG